MDSYGESGFVHGFGKEARPANPSESRCRVQKAFKEFLRLSLGIGAFRLRAVSQNTT